MTLAQVDQILGCRDASSALWMWLIQKPGPDRAKKDHKEFIKNNKLILKIRQRFKSERHNVFTEEIHKISLSSNDDKRIQSFDLKEHKERAKI